MIFPQAYSHRLLNLSFGIRKGSHSFFLICVCFFLATEMRSASDALSHNAEVISFQRYDAQSLSFIDETDYLRNAQRMVLEKNDTYFILQLDLQNFVADTFYYQIEGYDSEWLRFDNALIRSGNIPEGKYRMVVAKILPGGDKSIYFAADMQVRAGFFSGIRGYLATLIIALLMLFLFFKGRTLILKRDRNRTVRMLENTVQKRTVQLQQLLAQRELLLKEIHHRVKNNLQVISALLEMQGSRTTDENVRAAITEGQNRVLSIAFIHQNLYQHDDLKGVEIGSFLKELISHIRQVFETPACPVDVDTQVPQIFLDIDSAIPLGLIMNELLTNSYKYAFKDRSRGSIRIELKLLSDGDFYFHYFDDGVGLPKDFDFMRSNSLGLKLIRQLSRQLAGNIKYQYLDGSSFELVFKNLEARSQMT